MKKSLLTLAVASSVLFGFDFNLDSNAGAISNLKNLGMPVQNITLSLNNNKAITGADYDKSKEQFVLSNIDNGFYITNDKLVPIRYGQHDKHFIMEMEDSVGATWLKDEICIISYNKTFVCYEPVDIEDKAEQNSQWRHLLDGWDKWRLNDFANKNRFFTIRAKQQFILDFDYDTINNKFITASVPNDVRPSWSVAVFDGDDKMILEEYIPSIGESVNLKSDRDLSDYYITAIEVDDDIAYLLSKNYSTILKLNLKTKQIDDAFGFDGIANARAITIKDGKFYIFSREKKENKVFVFDMKN